MIKVLLIIFLVLLLLIGGDRGVVSLISIAGNLITFFIMIWLMAAGFNPFIVTFAGCLLVNSITLLYQNGKNIKTKSAFISVGIIMALLLFIVIFFSTNMHIEGLNEIEMVSEMSLYYSLITGVNMHSVSICMILIGLLGAVMDTAVSVSSGLYEVSSSKECTSKELFNSGMTIGKDILSTTVNTLYFAYIGEALMLLIYLKEYNYNFISILNSKAFLTDFTCIIFSMIGCLLIIPVTSYICSKLFLIEKEPQE